MSKKSPSLPKWCGLAGIVFAEMYMFFTVAGPRLQSSEMPVDSLIIRLVALGVLFGPFGLAAGTGIGLLLQGAIQMCKAPDDAKSPSKSSDPPH